MIELKDFILEKLDSCKKITLSFRIVHTDTESTKKNNEILTKRLKEQVLPYITHNNIIHKHLYRNGLHLNLIGFPFSLKIFCLIFEQIAGMKLITKWKNNEVNSSEITTEHRNDTIDGLKTLRLKHTRNPIIAQININLMRNKFETLASIVNSDIF